MRMTNRGISPLFLAGLLLTGCDGTVETVPPPPEPVSEIIGGAFATEEGAVITYDLRGDGETALVFIHCWACNRSFWKEQVQVFAEAHRVLAMDLPGHGESTADREAWTLSSLAEDVRALVEHLDLERVILVGHSMGGPVSVLAAPRMADRVIGVACVDTLHDVDAPWDAEALAPIVAMYEQDFTSANRQFVPMMFPEGADPATIEWVVDNANHANPAAAMALMADFPNLDFRQLLAELTVPIRCVNAAPLGQVIPETAVETNQRYADFDAATIDGVGHYLMLEKPDAFNEKLATAIRELDAASPPTAPDP